jgi:hypothetical protein
MKRILAVVVALVAAGEIAAEAVIHWRTASDADWLAAVDYLRKQRRSDDGIVFAPAWADPVGRLFAGNLITLEEAARPDRSRQARLFEVSIRGARHPAAHGRPIDDRSFGRVRVRLYERAAKKVLFDLTEQAAALGRQPKVAEIDFAPVLCVPLAPPSTWTVPEVPFGRELLIGTGIDDFQSRKDAHADVTLQVFIDDQLAVRIVHGNDDGWKKTNVDTSRHAGRTGQLRLVVASDNPRKRTFCVHFETHE